MTPLHTIAVLWCGGLALSAAIVGGDVRDGRLPRNVLLAGLALGLMTFAIVFPYDGHFFYGLEYEDAYEYAAGGALLESNPTLEGFLNPICLVGSRDNCEAIGTLSHPIGLSGLLALVYRLAGFQVYTASLVSIACFAATTSCVYLVSWMIMTSHWYSLFCSLAWTLAPSVFVMGGTSFSEPTSAFLIVLSVFLAFSWNARAGVGGPDVLRLLGLGIVLLLAVLVRRDNLALACALPLLAFLDAIDRGGGDTHRSRIVVRLGYLGLVSAWVLACAWLALGPSVTQVGEYIHPRASAFSIQYAMSTLRSFVASAGSWNRYGVTCVFVVAGLMLGWRSRAYSFVKVTLGAYVILFLTFAHSYYFVEIGEVPFLHFERYGLEIGPLVSLVTGWGLYEAGRWFGALPTPLGRLVQTVGCIGLAVLAVVCTSQAMDSRREWAQDEWRSRIGPHQEVCEGLPEGSTIISAEPLIYYLYCPQRVRVVSYQALGHQLTSDVLDSLIAQGDVFYVARFESLPASRGRWPLQRSILSERLGETKELAGAFEGTLFRLRKP